MKRLAALAALLWSAPVWCCPDLAGTYVCTYQDGSQETLVISQTVLDGVTTYDYAGSRIIGDNTTYPIPNDANLRGATFRAWCDPEPGSPLRAQIVAAYYSQGAPYGELILDMTYARVGQEVRQMTQGSIRNSGGQSPLMSEQVCVKR